MDWIYLSPHFDDAALSCGGLIWEQAQSGESVSIWTVCAGEPPEGALSPFAERLHARWESGPQAPVYRRAEDLASCQRLGAAHRYFSIPDCIYRRGEDSGQFLYTSEESLNGTLHSAEAPLIERLHRQMEQDLPQGAEMVCPLTLGNHVDHQLVRAAASRLKRRLWYYADFPYAARSSAWLDELSNAGWEYQVFPISTPGLAAWQASIAAHASQISTFWDSPEAMRASVEQFCQQMEGVRFWRQPA